MSYIKKHTVIVLLLVCLLSLTACQKEAEVSVSPLFYKVSDENSSVYILGSIHVGRMNIYPLPTEIMSAYGKCDTVMFEIDFQTTSDFDYEIPRDKTDALVGAETVERAIATIKEEYPSLKRIAQKTYPSVDMENIEQAGFFTLQGLLSLAADTKSALVAGCGIDRAFLGYALRDKKSIIGAESAEEQYKLTYYDLPSEAYRDILNEAIAVDETAKQDNALYEMWCCGDAAAIEQVELEPLRQAGEDSWQHMLYESFLIRNEHMTDKVVQQLENDETTFVVFGVAHIVGEEGIINQLQELGYTIHDFFCSANRGKPRKNTAF